MYAVAVQSWVTVKGNKSSLLQVPIVKHHVRFFLSKVKVDVNFNLEQATKAQRGSRGIVLLFLNLGAR